jgi:hypothetical protein
LRKEPGRAGILLDAVLVFLLSAVLIAPLFRVAYLDQWGSIESTFIADARFLMEHWPHPQWQPLWYTGTRFDYVYPPALRYGTAVIAKIAGWEPARAYHVLVAFFYCVGTVGVYLLALVGLRSRRAALLGAAAYSLMSPAYLILVSRRADSFRLAPHRLATLVRWGEGPHVTALALLVLALVFAWRALAGRRTADAVIAALLSAAVVSTNFYGATALAVFYPILVWSFWVTRRERRMATPVILIPVAAYGLTAFWLVPSYFRITAENMRFVASPGNAWSAGSAAALVATYMALTWRLANRRTERTWAVFLAGCVTFFSLNVAGNYFFHFRITGEPHRWIPELDVVYVLGAITVLRWMWNRSERLARIAAAVMVGAAFFTTLGYVRHGWQMFRADRNYQNRIEYQISEWAAQNMPDARVYTAGSVRFWFDVWHDLPQMTGGSDQGVINDRTMDAQYVNRNDPNPEASILWMQCLGVDAVYVSGPGSQEIYKDDKAPGRFAGVLAEAYNNHKGDVIYRVPRRYPARARVVETAGIDALQRPHDYNLLASLRAYADAIERGPDAPVTLTRDGTDAMRVRARLSAGQSILVQESYDPGWHAWSGRQLLRVRRDAMGFLLIDAPPGDQEIRLEFVTPRENRVGRAITVLTVVLLLFWWLRGSRQNRQAAERVRSSMLN